MSDYMNEEAMNPDEAAEIKRRAATERATKLWRADLHNNVPDSLAWANGDPFSMPGEILFHQRDNGQLWTWTLL